jgi:CheY-like chemotaxis protein
MKKILIVEDDQIVANIYRNKFSVEGFQVEVANDGNAGLDLAVSFRPDAVLLDLMLPLMTGVDFMKEIRAKAGFQNLPVIVFSNTYLTNMVQEAWKAGATKCLSKANCTPKQVIEVLRTTLNINGGGTPGTLKATPATNTPAKSNGAAPAQTGTASGTAASTDAEFQNDLLKTFSQSLPSTLSALRTQLQALIKADNNPARLKLVHELYRRIHGLTGNAGAVGLVYIAQIADGLEALLKELFEKPETVNPSTLRTIASTVDFLGLLFERGVVKNEDLSTARILVVDDEAISRRAVSHALEKGKLKATSIQEPEAALDLLAKNPYDLIFLDIDMPGMNGFELCSKLRTLPAHKKTPVVFVTTMNDFESRANSTMSGGNDFIAKPFLFMELAVKALVHVLRGRLGPAKRTALAPAA